MSTITTHKRLYIFLFLIFFPAFSVQIPGAAHAADTPDLLMAAIDQTVSKLVPEPRTVILPSEQAAAARDSIRRGDFAAARKILADALARSKIQYWRFYPFGQVIHNITPDITPAGDAAYLDQVNQWVAQDKDSALPYLVRAQYFYDVSVLANTETDKTQAVAASVADSTKAIQLDEANPVSQFLLLNALSMNGNSPELESAFQAAIKKFPNYYVLYRDHLQSLSPGLKGDVKPMIEFVDRYAGHAAENSPLRMLHLQLYASLLNTASETCSHSVFNVIKIVTGMADPRECIETTMTWLSPPDLGKNVATALALYKKTDPYEFTITLDPILFDILDTADAQNSAGLFLQQAAAAMDSDTQLMETNPGHNNYMIDRATAHIWRRRDHPENAEKKYKEAAVDTKNMTFPDEGQKDEALAEIYDHLAGLYNDSGQYANVIPYQQAAVALGGYYTGGVYRRFGCYAYYRLKDYTAAVRECSAHLSHNEVAETRFWLGMSEQELGQIDAALKDLKIVADTGISDFGSSAAIQRSVIYGNLNDMPKQLESLNSYPYIFNPSRVKKSTVAIAYNNRCYAYLHMNELQKALDDCNTSLQYGNIPDAYDKRQEILKKLEAK